ncbi:MAG: hypothetical protein ACYDBS_06135, partial [Acidimicrobiales bacterium]
MKGSAAPSKVAFVGHRLGARDGLSEASRVWQRAFRSLGSTVTTIAGAGDPLHLVQGLDASTTS